MIVSVVSLHNSVLITAPASQISVLPVAKLLQDEDGGPEASSIFSSITHHASDKTHAESVVLLHSRSNKHICCDGKKIQEHAMNI